MQLIMNVPTDKNGIDEFRSEFAKLQAELLLFSIRKLNVSIDDKEKLLYLAIDKIKERLVD